VNTEFPILFGAGIRAKEKNRLHLSPPQPPFLRIQVPVVKPVEITYGIVEITY
jgi:hypothetical protein